MEYVSTSEIAKIWDISRRRVTTLCREGRVEGAVFVANTWLVPKDAKKPEDPRRVRKMEKKMYRTLSRNLSLTVI